MLSISLNNSTFKWFLESDKNSDNNNFFKVLDLTWKTSYA